MKRISVPRRASKQSIKEKVALGGFRPILRLLLLWIAASAAYLLNLTAQDGKLRVDVQLATAEVSVLDRSGNFVRHLKREDFRLLEDGKERPILALDEVTALPAEDRSQPALQSELQRPGKIVLLLFDDGTVSPVRLKATRELAADFVRRHMNTGDLFGVASHALSLKLLQSFTREKTEVLRALQQPALSYARNLGAAPSTRDLQKDSITGPRLRSPRLFDQSEQEMQESRIRGLSLLQTFDGLCSSLAKVRGRKTVLLFTEDLAVPSDLQKQQVQTASSAQAANVVFHCIDVRSLSAGASAGGFLPRLPVSSEPDPTQRNERTDSQSLLTAFTVSPVSGRNPDRGIPGSLSRRSGIFALQSQNRNLGNATSEINSEAPFDERDPLRQSKNRRPVLENVVRALSLSTGGEAIFNTGEVSSQLDRLDRQISNYYVLGFSPVPPGSRAGPHHIEIHTTFKDAQLKYSKTYSPARSRETLASSPQEARLLAALEEPVSLSQVPLRFETAFFHDAGAGGLTNMIVAVKIGREALHLRKEGARRVCTAGLMGVAYGLDGKVAGRISEKIHVEIDASEEAAFRGRDLLYHTSLELRPGTYRLKIAVADEAGKTGAAERVFSVPSLPMSGLGMSSVVVTQQMVQLPGLIQSVQDRLLEEASPLRYRGTEVSMPVDLEADQNSSIVVFYRLYNLTSSQQAGEITAEVQLINEVDEMGAFPPVSLTDVAYPAGEHQVAVGLTLPLKEVPPGNYRVRVANTDSTRQFSAAGETRLRVK